MDFAYDRWGMIDGVTRYPAARIIKTKEKNEVLMKIFDMWIAYFERPGKYLEGRHHTLA